MGSELARPPGFNLRSLRSQILGGQESHRRGFTVRPTPRRKSVDVALHEPGGLRHQVLYLEQALERRLGIEDAAVDGEIAVRTTAA